jgi:hypothetical protein
VINENDSLIALGSCFVVRIMVDKTIEILEEMPPRLSSTLGEARRLAITVVHRASGRANLSTCNLQARSFINGQVG